jgi:hypothetical protein
VDKTHGKIFTITTAPQTYASRMAVHCRFRLSFSFGGLMAWRYELSTVWERAAVAACVVAILGWGDSGSAQREIMSQTLQRSKASILGAPACIGKRILIHSDRVDWF